MLFAHAKKVKPKNTGLTSDNSCSNYNKFIRIAQTKVNQAIVTKKEYRVNKKKNRGFLSLITK